MTATLTPEIRCQCGSACLSSLDEEQRWVEIPPGTDQPKEAGWWGRRREVRSVHTVRCAAGGCGVGPWSVCTPWRKA